MVKNVDIVMRAPICGHGLAPLRWSTEGGDLHVWCALCDTGELVAREALPGRFVMDRNGLRPVPVGAEARVLRFPLGGRVP